MLLYYCIASCDKCRAARKLLREKNIPHQEIDMRKTAVSDEQIEAWIARYGIDAILNRSSATWRKLDAKTQAQIYEAPVALLKSNAAMMQRPILDFGDHILTNKAALQWLEQFA